MIDKLQLFDHFDFFVEFWVFLLFKHLLMSLIESDTSKLKD